MSFDDPGWGGDGDFGKGGDQGWGGSKPPRQRPGWMNVSTIGGAAAALVIVVAIVLAVTLHHSSKKKVAVVAVKTTHAVTPSKPSTSSAKPSPSVTGETIATYDAAADKICKAHASAISGVSSTDLEGQYDALVDEFGDLESLTSPSQQTTTQEQWIQQLSDGLTALTHHNEAGYMTAIANANTTAGKLGMTVCNNGY